MDVEGKLLKDALDLRDQTNVNNVDATKRKNELDTEIAELIKKEQDIQKQIKEEKTKNKENKKEVERITEELEEKIIENFP